MKLTIESTGEFVDVTAGRSRVWKGFTETGEQCLLFVRCWDTPTHARIQEFEDLNPAPASDPLHDCGVSGAEIERIGELVFHGDPRRLRENESKVVTELTAIADDEAADSTLRLEALGLMAEVGLGEDDDPTASMPTSEFWGRVIELRRRRDAT